MVWIYGLDSSNKIILTKQTGCYDILRNIIFIFKGFVFQQSN